jgi:hypothetical protein
MIARYAWSPHGPRPPQPLSQLPGAIATLTRAPLHAQTRFKDNTMT